jgi:hypothetical protein
MAKNSFVTGHDEHIGKGDHAGMPRDVKMENYPPCRGGVDKEIDDTMSGIDDVATGAEGKKSKYLSNQK